MNQFGIEMDERLAELKRQVEMDPENISLRKVFETQLMRINSGELILKLIGSHAKHIYYPNEDHIALCKKRSFRDRYPKEKDVSKETVCIRCCVLYCETPGNEGKIFRFNDVKMPGIIPSNATPEFIYEKKTQWFERLEVLING